MFPARTGFGVPVFVTARSAWPEDATTTFTVAELFDGFGSVVLEETFAVSVMIVPDGTVAPTFTTTVNVDEAPDANVGIEQEITPGVQVHPPVPELWVTETKVVLVGIVSLNTTLLALAGPLFVTTTVYVMLFPCSTGLGVAAFVIAKSAVPAAPTRITTVALLFARFGSFVPDVIESVSTICVPLAVPVFTFTTRVKVAVPFAPEGISGFVQVIFPVPPNPGVVQFQFAAAGPEMLSD